VDAAERRLRRMRLAVLEQAALGEHAASGAACDFADVDLHEARESSSERRRRDLSSWLLFGRARVPPSGSVPNQVDAVLAGIGATVGDIDSLCDVARTKEQFNREFEFPDGWGGTRKGAGAKRKCERSGVSHARRAEFAARFPVHVTMKLKSGLPSLRRGSAHSLLIASFAATRERRDLRLVHYSIQSNHLHLLCEARGRSELARAIQALAVRIAKGLNALWKRAGALFADRYHDQILRTPREVRHALGYVLSNAAKHGLASAIGRPDPFSSGRWFDGWRAHARALDLPPSPLSRANTWLLSVGWSRHGPIEIAGARPRSSCNAHR